MTAALRSAPSSTGALNMVGSIISILPAKMLTQIGDKERFCASNRRSASFSIDRVSSVMGVNVKGVLYVVKNRQSRREWSKCDGALFGFGEVRVDISSGERASVENSDVRAIVIGIGWYSMLRRAKDRD